MGKGEGLGEAPRFHMGPCRLCAREYAVCWKPGRDWIGRRCEAMLDKAERDFWTLEQAAEDDALAVLAAGS